MEIYWTFNSIPELKEIPKDKRKIIWRRCYLKSLRNWQTWVAFVVCGLCAGAGAGLGLSLGNLVISVIGAGIGGAIGGFFTGQIQTKMARRYICEVGNEI